VSTPNSPAASPASRTESWARAAWWSSTRPSSLVFLVSFAAYVIGLAPDLYWLDSSELAAGAFTLGVAHPPGHPLALLAGKLIGLLPLGPLALRVGLASALAGAGAAAQTTRLGQILARRVAPESPSGWLGAAAGLLFALSYAAAFQAVRPEVYALSALLSLTAVVELLRWDESGDRRRLLLAALAVGLGLANHHLLTLTVALPAVIFAALHQKRGPLPTFAARVGVAGALGLSVYAYLPLRALNHPLIDWGAPTSAARVFWVVSARAFQKAIARGQAEAADALGVIPALAVQLHLIGALLALGGLYLLVRLPQTRRAGIFLAAALVLGAAAPAMVGFDEANPDAYGYLEASVALAAAAACVVPALVLSHVRRASSIVAPLFVAAAVAWGAFQWPRVTLAGFHDAGRVAGAWLEETKPGAPAVTSYFQTIFAVWYLRAVEGRRPDIFVIHRHFLSYPGYRDDLLRRDPSLEPLLGEREVRQLPDDAQIEYDIELPQPLVARSHVIPVPGVDLDEPQTRRFAAWMALIDAHRACRLAAPATEVEAAFTRARALVGNPPELQDCFTLVSSLAP
jgi:hypothetical protein